MERHGGMPLANFPVDWEVASDSGFRDVVAKGTHLARPELAQSVHVEVAGLQPDRPSYYRFTAGGERSLRGRARTLPAPGDRKSVVSGKSVSVRVDRGGRRKINKKNQQKQNTKK